AGRCAGGNAGLKKRADLELTLGEDAAAVELRDEIRERERAIDVRRAIGVLPEQFAHIAIILELVCLPLEAALVRTQVKRDAAFIEIGNDRRLRDFPNLIVARILFAGDAVAEQLSAWARAAFALDVEPFLQQWLDAFLLRDRLDDRAVGLVIGPIAEPGNRLIGKAALFLQALAVGSGEGKPLPDQVPEIARLAGKARVDRRFAAFRWLAHG